MLSAYSVTSTLDTVDAAPGNGVAADVNGQATLRAAVMDANATPSADTITLGAGLFKLSIAGKGENAAATGDLDVTGNLTINGAGAGQTIIDGAQLDRLFHVLAGSTLTLRNVTIQNGRETNGGGIENDGTLNLENVTLTSNSAVTRGGAIYNNTGKLNLTSVNVVSNISSEVASGQGSAIGGGIASFGGTVNIVNSQIASNTASGDGGGVDSRSTTLTITNSSFHDNFATTGGAVRLFNGTATLTNNTFNADHATASGGAIASNICALTITGGSFTGNYLAPVPPSGTARTGGSLNLVGVNSASPAVTITRVTFQQTGSGDGGAIYNSNAQLNVTNSTFDHVTGRQGGAINNNSGGTLVMVNTTIVGCSATFGGAILNSATAQLTNCTISCNTTTGQGVTTSAAVANSSVFTSLNNLIAGNNGPDVSGVFSSLGGNLIGCTTASTGFNKPSDQCGNAASPINPLLGPLCDNGGVVPTMAVLAKSLARDKGVNGGPSTDTRGVSRTIDPTDVGAFEFQNHLPVAGPYNVVGTEDNEFDGQLAATDEDGDALTFELLTSPTSGQLTLQSDGTFQYVPAADYFGSVSFRYRASDGRGFSNDVDAEIFLTAVNDAPFVGDQDFTIPENSAAGTTIGTIFASDIDSTVLTASIVSGNDSGAFFLDPDSHELRVADGSQLNFEANPTITLVVSITDDGTPSASSLATITVHLTDVNDAPVVAAQALSVDENSANGTVVGTVAVTDEDAVQNFTYEIIDSDLPDVFAIDSATGQITVADGSQLDFESQSVITLTVQVTDPGSPTFVQQGTVTINLNDVNDAPMVGDQEFSVAENSPVGTFVDQAIAHDVDSSQLTIEIISGNADGAFSIDPSSGEIFVADSTLLDFETHPTFTLLIRVTDNGDPAMSSEATIIIDVADVNEAPEAQAAVFNVDENAAAGTVVGTVDATDVDLGQTLTFAIVDPSGPFAIDPATGAITVADPSQLDFETQSSYTLLVRVTDNGDPALSSDAEVIITLNNVNDAPTLDGQAFSVAENSAAGTSVGQVTGFDQDLGQSLTYAITDGNADGQFAIDPTTGEITVADGAALNFEATSAYSLTVTATDNGDPSLSASAVVTIAVTNVNESPELDPANLAVPENSANGTSLGTVSATDPDADQSLTYAIESGNDDGVFAINPETGEITVASSAALNFEATPSFTLVVSVTDNGDPTLSDSATVVITLLDVNEAPHLETQTFSIAENSANGSDVGTITGTDPDAGQSLTYAITAGNAFDAFAIDPATGHITVNNGAALNFELNPQFTLTVTVHDDANPSLSASTLVHINLRDVNEAPQIAEKTFTLSQRPDVGGSLGSMTASDPDAGQSLTYAIVSGNDAGIFAIDPATGLITVAIPSGLNFDGSPTLSLVVQVTDNGDPALSASANVSIKLALVNQNQAPHIEARSFTLDENSANGTVVGTITGTDPDAGQTLTYSITGGNSTGAFAINPATGQITVAKSEVVNFETNPGFNLEVRVTDNGSPVKFAATHVTISLNNVNEAPQLAEKTFSLDEKSPNGTAVGTVTGTDPDAGQTLTYSIVSGNTNNAFTINPTTGAITVANSAALDFATIQKFTLQVKATDNGNPALSATTSVTINLKQVSTGVKTVSIDVGFCDTTNTIRLGRQFNVAILGSSTFDVRTIDIGSLRFGKLGTENSLDRTCRGLIDYCYRDVNHDGRLDIVVDVNANLTGLRIGDTQATLTGHIKNGPNIIATSPITVRSDFDHHFTHDDRDHRDAQKPHRTRGH